MIVSKQRPVVIGYKTKKETFIKSGLDFVATERREMVGEGAWVGRFRGVSECRLNEEGRTPSRR